MKRILLIAILALSVLPKTASAAIINFDLSPANVSAFSNVFINNGNMSGTEYFFSGNPGSVAGKFSFDTSSGIGNLTANLVHASSNQNWKLTGVFSQVSFINSVSGYDPGSNYSLYFDYLLNHNDGSNTAIVFDSLDLNLTTNVNNPTYKGLKNFAGGEMGGYDAYIHFNGFNQFQLGYWCYTDYDNDGQGEGDSFVKNSRSIQEAASCDQYWNLNGVSTDPNNPSNAVPEPATMTLLGMGLAGLGMRKKAKK